jgi:hypothetical protein
MTNMEESNRLPELAARIRSEHEATATALKSSAEHAMAAGDALLEAKALVDHGGMAALATGPLHDFRAHSPALYACSEK